MSEQIRGLIEDGLHVQVLHLRITPAQREVYAGQERGNFPYEGCLMRSAEFLREQELDISSRGGATAVVIYSAQGDLLGSGHAYCNPNENFDKKLGTLIAVNRAILNMNGGGIRELARA